MAILRVADTLNKYHSYSVKQHGVYSRAEFNFKITDNSYSVNRLKILCNLKVHFAEIES